MKIFQVFFLQVVIFKPFLSSKNASEIFFLGRNFFLSASGLLDADAVKPDTDKDVAEMSE